MTNKKNTKTTTKVVKKMDTKKLTNMEKRIKSLTTQNKNLKENNDNLQKNNNGLCLENLGIKLKGELVETLLDQKTKAYSRLSKKFNIVNKAQDSMRYEITGQIIDYIIEKNILIERETKEEITKNDVCRYNKQLIRKIRKISDNVVVEIVKKTIKDIEDLE